jgi:hypothetical protein
MIASSPSWFRQRLMTSAKRPSFARSGFAMTEQSAANCASSSQAMVSHWSSLALG